MNTYKTLYKRRKSQSSKPKKDSSNTNLKFYEFKNRSKIYNPNSRRINTIDKWRTAQLKR